MKKIKEIKIIISPKFGAGWLTWSSYLSRKQQVIILTDSILISAVEKQDNILFQKRVEELQELFTAEHNRETKCQYGPALCTQKVKKYRVIKVNPPFGILDYDGAESITPFSAEPYCFLPEDFE